MYNEPRWEPKSRREKKNVRRKGVSRVNYSKYTKNGPSILAVYSTERDHCSYATSTKVTCAVSGFPGNRPALTHHVIWCKTTGKLIYLSKALGTAIKFFSPFNGFTCFPEFQCTSRQLVRFKLSSRHATMLISNFFPELKSRQQSTFCGSMAVLFW